MNKLLKYPEYMYIDINIFEGDFGDGITDFPAKMVKTRKVHKCHFGNTVHEISMGSVCRYDKAIVDGEWVSTYSCVGCMDEWIDGEEE